MNMSMLISIPNVHRLACCGLIYKSSGEGLLLLSKVVGIDHNITEQ